MDESQSPVPQSAAPARDHLKRKVDKLVDRARWTMWWERRLAAPVGADRHHPRLPDRILARHLARHAAACAGPRTRPFLSRRSASRFGPSCALAGRPARGPSTGSTATPASAMAPARTLDDKLALGDADPGSRALWDLHRTTRRSGDREVRSVGPAAGHAEARPLRPARRGHAGRRRERLRRRAGSRLAACRRLRLEAAEGGRALLPGRRVGRPAALYPRSAADDRPCRRAAEAARACQVDGGRARRRPGRSRDHARAGPHAAAGAREPAHRPARAALHPRGQCRVERAHRARRRDAPDARGHSRPAARDQLRAAFRR